MLSLHVSAVLAILVKFSDKFTQKKHEKLYLVGPTVTVGPTAGAESRLMCSERSTPKPPRPVISMCYGLNF